LNGCRKGGEDEHGSIMKDAHVKIRAEKRRWSEELLNKRPPENRETDWGDPIEAVKTYATIGEICGVLREVFGEYRQDRAVR
jgi:methylmalonyl-CoA mutase N-terminal domain/subunit